jgi:hypothetical protein
MTLYVPTLKFVSFNSLGEITSISNSQPSTNDFIKVEYDQVSKLLSGEESISLYEVMFDTLKKQYQLSKKKTENNKIYDVNDTIFEIIKNESSSDLTVVQNNVDNRWEFSVADTLADALLEKSLYSETVLFFSITDHNNPFIVHQFITIELYRLLEERKVFIHFNTNINKNKLYSIYTKKMFEQYSYEVINE